MVLHRPIETTRGNQDLSGRLPSVVLPTNLEPVRASFLVHLRKLRTLHVEYDSQLRDEAGRDCTPRSNE